MLIAELTKQS